MDGKGVRLCFGFGYGYRFENIAIKSKHSKAAYNIVEKCLVKSRIK